VRYWLVIPAAGSGRRFGERNPKQYVPLHGRTVIEWALGPFISDARCLGIAVALAATDTHWPHIAARLPAVTVAAGGGERCESVRNALAVLSRRAAPDDWVLVHDAARPCLELKDRDRLIERASTHTCGGLLAIPSADTLKQADADRQVERTLDRTVLWQAQTPQMFRYAKLCSALDVALNARRFPTDEAQALEWLGERPLLVEGSPGNLKITSAEDLQLAEALLAKARTR
jgi:2-C-methyl-D-erythritol 4-phosphate cytidylyltransferase